MSVIDSKRFFVFNIKVNSKFTRVGWRTKAQAMNEKNREYIHIRLVVGLNLRGRESREKPFYTRTVISASLKYHG